MASTFLGVDVGTSGVKAILIDAAGEVLAAAVTPLQLSTPQPGWAEQDPDAWWSATAAAIRTVLAARPNDSPDAVGVSGQMHSSVFLDTSGDVIRPALLWCDGRTTDECREITERVGGENRLRDFASNPALEGFTLPKVLWLRRHEPEAFARLATVLLPKDFIRYKLTGALATEPSDASATLMYDTAHRRWSTEILAAVGLPATIVPDVGGSAEILGRVNVTAAGVGVVAPGEAVASWGTSGTVLAPMSEPRVDPTLRAHTFCHVVPGMWYLMGVVLSAGGAFAWYRDQLARDLTSTGEANERLNAEAMAIAPGADGVTFLPYLQGERTPHRDASARGAILGLSLAHSRAHVTRAVIEGVCFALRDSITILRELGVDTSHMLLTGGGARVPFLRRLQAEVFGLPVSTVNREEGPAYGAALLAAVGAGAFRDLSAAAASTLTRAPVEIPAPGSHAAYEEPYRRFRESFHAAHPGAHSRR